MPTDLLFIRHGEARYGSNDGLTDLGVRQAESLARRLNLEGIDLLYASTLPRARETAEGISACTGHEIHFDSRLREIDVGDFARQLDVKQRSEDYYRSDRPSVLDFSQLKGEGPTDLHDRVKAVIKELFLEDEFDQGRVAIVSHGGFINSALSFFLGLNFDGIMRFRTANTSVSSVRVTSGGALILSINDTAHFFQLAD